MNMNLAERLFSAGRHDEALAQLAGIQQTVPGFAPGKLRQARYASVLGRHDEAIAILSELPKSSTDTQLLSTSAVVLARAGKREAALELKTRLLDLFEHRQLSATRIAHVCVALGDLDEAMTWLQRALQTREVVLLWAGVDSLLAPLRDRPDFIALMKQVGVPVIA
jgi:tetratricopeptide (TPR) repeat protein